MNYKRFTITDFICDEYFQDWAIHPDEQKNEFWNNWIQAHPDKKETVEQAKQVLLHIQFKEDVPAQEQIQNALAKHLAEIQALEEENVEEARIISINRINRFRKLRKFAAIFIGIMLIGAAAFYYNWRTATTTVATNYGELKHLILPDKTEVTLNAHSTITYLKHWRSNHPREVQLTGEAFFEVTHLNKNENDIKNSERFIVTTNDLKVEVLGTTFDVRNRRGKTHVVLKTGKVKVAFNNAGHHDVTLRPGEMLSYESTTKQVKKVDTDPVVQTAWIDKKIILQDATVQTIIEYLEDNYGYKVILKDTTLAHKKMGGTLLLDNLPDVLFVLSSSLDIKIYKEDSTLIFSK